MSQGCGVGERKSTNKAASGCPGLDVKTDWGTGVDFSLPDLVMVNWKKQHRINITVRDEEVNEFGWSCFV